MSIVSGILLGIRSSIRSGVNPSLSGNPLAGVSQDATSSKYVPATSGEWTTLAGVAGVSAPSFGWGMQDASGALAASVGSVTLASEGSRQAYQQTVAGWSRKGIQSKADGWLSSDASFPDISTTSQTLLVYAKVASSGTTTTDVTYHGGLATAGRATDNAAKHLVPMSISTAGTAGASDVTGAVRPIVVMVNRTSSTVRVFTDQEKLTVALGAVTGKGIYITGGLLGDDITYLLGACWATDMTDAQVKTLLQTLGWTIPWS